MSKSGLGSVALLDDVIGRASLRGEQVINGGRVLLCSLALLRLLVVTPLQGFAWTHPRPLLVASGTATVLLFSALWTWRPRGDRLEASTLLDPFGLLWTFLPVVLWPGLESRGVMTSGYFSAFMVSVAICTLRLQPRLVLLQAVSNGLVLALVLGLDLSQGVGKLGYGVADAITAALMYVAVCAFSYVSVRWTRRLVFEGAEATLQAERARRALGAYLSPALASELLGGRELVLGGERRHVAVLFADLRAFTSYAQERAPEVLVEELNAWLEAMVGAIRAEGGTVDKYMGDAVMAVFGTHTHARDAAACAIRAAIGMQRALDRLNEERRRRDLPALRHGIGVHSGEVIAGNIGTPDQLQFTVIGDAVNVASRLEATTKDLGVDVLISDAAVSEAARTGLDTRLLRPLERLRLRGREEEVQTWTLAVSDANIT